jgi:hypothetical protein
MGTDIICYGAHLAHYLMLEFVDRGTDAYAAHTQEPRTIAIWSDLAG